MNTLNIKKAVIVVWLALAVLVGPSVVGSSLGLDLVPQTHACGLGSGTGGGC